MRCFVTSRDWDSTNTTDKDFIHVDLGKCEKLVFVGCKFIGCYWSEMGNCSFVNCVFDNCSVESAVISETRFDNCTITNLEMLKCLIQSTIFKGGEVRDSTFWGSRLVDVYFDNLVGFVGVGEVSVDNVKGLELSIKDSSTVGRVIYDKAGDYIFSTTVSGRSSTVLKHLRTSKNNEELLKVVQSLLGGEHNGTANNLQ